MAAIVCLITATIPAEGAISRHLPGAGSGPGAYMGTDMTAAEAEAAAMATLPESLRPALGQPYDDPTAVDPGPFSVAGTSAVTHPAPAPDIPAVNRPTADDLLYRRPSDAAAPSYGDPLYRDPAPVTPSSQATPTPTPAPVPIPAPTATPAAARKDTKAPTAPTTLAKTVTPRSVITSVTLDPRTLGAHVFHGKGFDACTAPDLDTMSAWRDSPYGAVGVYIGGRARSCAQPNLSRSWVHAVSGMGWRILPIYVGSQSPCATNAHQRLSPIDAGHPDSQGASEAADAARAAAALGIARNSPVYLDMESYDTRPDRCTSPVLGFTQSWSRNLRARGYLPGFYSSADSGIAQIEAARAAGLPDLPDLMWFARWGVAPSIYGEPSLPSGVWRPYRRIHQYVGDTRESYGGYSLAIDRNFIDAPVAIIS